MNQAEKRLNDFEKGQKVLEIVRKFIQDYNIHCIEDAYDPYPPECIYDLTASLCEAVNEYKPFSEEDEFITIPEEIDPSSNGHYIGLDR